MVYDLLVVGNGLAAQNFLYELFTLLKSDVKNSQNFSVAQVYDSKVFSPASLHTTASVSLNGIKKGTTVLGDVLYDSFVAFSSFVEKNGPRGVEVVEQMVCASNDLNKEKLKRRHCDLSLIDHHPLKKDLIGVLQRSYIISPEEFGHWFDEFLDKVDLDRFTSFFKGLTLLPDKSYECDLFDRKIRARKVLFCTGAYTKVLSSFFDLPEMHKTKVVSGSFLLKKTDLNQGSFFLTLDGHNLIYRSGDKTLLLGSASIEGAYAVSDVAELKKIHGLFNEHLNFSLGAFEDFKCVSGLRHKGPQRLPVVGQSSLDKNMMMMSGFYKNGFSFAPYFAKKMVKDLF